MSPGDIKVLWPSADEIARSLVTACRIEGDDPIAVFKGEQAPRSRVYALLALAHEYPTTPRRWLGRALGDERVQPKVLKTINRQAAQWFVLDHLNDVRAACCWSPMTMADVLAAPRLYCGRSWSDFVEPRADEAQQLGDVAAAEEEPEAAPAPEPTPNPVLSTPEPEPEPELEPAPPPVVEIDEAPPAAEPASEFPLSEAVEKTDTVEDPIDLPPLADFTRLPAPPAPITAAVTDLQAAFAPAPVERKVDTPPAAPPKPRAPLPSGRAAEASRAVAALTGAAQTIRETKASRKPSAPVRDGLSTFRAAELGRGVVSYRRADAPAEMRGMVVVTAELLGDPTPEQRARMAATPGRNILSRGERW